MKKSLRKTIAASAVFAVALAGGVAASDATAASKSAAAKRTGITKFAYKANVFGTKAVLNGVELKTLKDALAVQKCTRQLRGEKVKGSALSTDNLLPFPDEIKDLIHISPSTSRTKTYRVGNTYGVRGQNVIADIKVGGPIQVGDTTVNVPVLKIEGLKSVADSFNKNGKFGHQESFGFGGISLEIPEGDVIPPEVQDLLDIIQDNLPITETVNQVIDLLKTVGVIEIGDYLSLALGHTAGRAGKHSAQSNAYALRIQVNNPQNDAKTILQLGRAYSRISDGVPSGVFRSTMSALDLKLGDLVHFGGVSPQTIDCEGTGGKVKTKKVAAASVLLDGLVVDLTGVKYSWMGKQLPKKKAKGFVKTQIGAVSIPAADIVINGITSKVNMRSKKPGVKVKRKVKTQIGSIMVGGTKINLAPGQSHSWDGGVIRYQVRQNDDFYGTEVRALKIQLFEQNVVLTLAESAGRIFFK